MAGYQKTNIFARVLVLILLILVLVVGGAVWFDYLGIIDAKAYLSPLYRTMGLQPRSDSAAPPTEIVSLDAERLAIQMEALDLRSKELDKREQDVAAKEAEILQMSGELEERQKALDEREKSFNARLEQFDNRMANIEQNARYLVGMPPEKAVAVIAAMDDQDAIDVFRMTEELARQGGTTSMVSYWLSLLPADRAAELQRKMAGKPRSVP